MCPHDSESYDTASSNFIFYDCNNNIYLMMTAMGITVFTYWFLGATCHTPVSTFLKEHWPEVSMIHGQGRQDAIHFHFLTF